jgi:hypothetical protein
MSSFDPTQFLDATTTEALTRRAPLPAGQDVVGVIGDLSIKPWASKDGTKSGYKMEVPLRFDLTAYPDLRTAVNADTVTITDTIMLDVTDSGSIDYSPGKNSRLRKYREALGMNAAGVPFSPRAMTGRMIKARIKHEPYNDEIYERVEGVSKA